MSESAVGARRNALIAAITGDAVLGGMLQGEQVYPQRKAPEGSPFPYILFARTLENDKSYLMQPGQEGVEDLACWHIDIHGAQEVYEALYRALNKRKIPLTGHLMIYGKLSYVDDLEDRTREAWGVIARYRGRTINA